MRKIILLLMLISFSAFGQPNPDYHRYGARTKFVQPDTLSTSLRDGLSPKLGTLIYHKDTGVSQWEQWDGDSWEELGGDGAVSSVNFKVGAVVIDPDDLYDFSTINKFVTQEEKDLIFTAIQTETDPIFNAWDKDYNDLINKPTIPSSLAAADITVSPSIGGETDAYAVMQANRTSIDSIQANMSSGIDTEFQAETYSSTFNYTFDPENPNKYVDLTGNIDIEIFGTVNGDAGNLYLNRGDGTELITFANGTPPTDTRYRTGASDIIELFFIHSDAGIQWYNNNPHDGSNYSVPTATGTTQLDFANKDFIKLVLEGDEVLTATLPDYETDDLTLHLTNDGVGSHDVTFPTTFIFEGGTEPTLTTTADRTDILKFDYRDGHFFNTFVGLDYDLPEPPPTYTVVARVNVGSTTPVTATDGLGDWVSGLATGPASSGNLAVTAGSNIATTSFSWIKHASIPAAMPDADFQSLFDSARFDAATGAEMTYTISGLTAGEYKVRIYLGESVSPATIGSRVFDLLINGVIEQDDLDMVAIFGATRTAGMLEYDITIAGTSIAILTNHGVDNPQYNGIEILKKD